MSRLENRRRERSAAVTGAVALLLVVSVLVAGALFLDRPGLTVAAAVLAVLAGWVAVRLTWTAVIAARDEQAQDRADVAIAYRKIAAERNLENQRVVTTLSDRLADSGAKVAGLQRDLSQVTARAERAEASVSVAHQQLHRAEGRVRSLQEELAAWETPAEQPTEDVDTEPASAPGSKVEFGDLEVDPTKALIVWEEEQATQRAIVKRTANEASSDAQSA